MPILRLAADEDFHGAILRGRIRQKPELDIVRVQDDPDVSGLDDPVVLEWAASMGCVLLTRDVRTMTAFARERVAAGLRMPGIIAVKRSARIGVAIEDLLIVIECSFDGEWEGRIGYVPL